MSFRKLIEKEISSPAFTASILGEKPLALSPLEGGSASLVYCAELRGGAYRVLKFSEHASELLHEQYFLEAWSERGIRTPEILHCAPLPNGLQGVVLQMEFMQGQNLFPLMERGAVDCAKVLHDMGSILAVMHSVMTTGYGNIIVLPDGSIEGEEKTFSATLNTLEWRETINKNQQNGDLLDSEVPLITKGAALLDDQRAKLGGCFTHNDFRAGNILFDRSDIQPYTVIDPKPAITHPYLCLAYSLILEEIHGRNDPAHMRQGYETITSLDNDALHAALFLKALKLLPRWGQNGKPYAKPLRKLFHREKVWLLKCS